MSMATVGSIVSIASSAFSAYQSSQAAGQAMEDPFGKGNRKFYQRQLGRLHRYPGAVFEDPTFQAALNLGLQGVERKMASQGFLGSGNEALGLFQFGQAFGLDWFNKQQITLGNLAGAQMGPSYGAAAQFQGQANQGFADAFQQLGYLFPQGGGTTGGTAGGGVDGTQTFGGSFGSGNLGGYNNWELPPVTTPGP